MLGYRLVEFRTSAHLRFTGVKMGQDHWVPLNQEPRWEAVSLKKKTGGHKALTKHILTKYMFMVNATESKLFFIEISINVPSLVIFFYINSNLFIFHFLS